MNINSVGIIGYGKFGKLLYELIHRANPSVEIKVFSRNPIKGETQFSSLEEICKSDLVIPAVPVSSLKPVLSEISTHIHSNGIVMDVSSVKEFPVKLMKNMLPKTVTIIGSHPLFGPGTVEKLKNMYDLKIVMSCIQGDQILYRNVQQLFKNINLTIIEMIPEEHDKLMSKSQFISHIIAGILKDYQFQKTSVDTNSAQLLHDFETMIQADTQLLQDMFIYNQFCKLEFEKFETSYNNIKSLLIHS